MLLRSFLTVLAYTCVKCQNFQYQSELGYAQSVNQFNNPQNQNYGSQKSGYGARIQDYTNINQYLVAAALISTAAIQVSYAPLRISVKRNDQLLVSNNGSEVSFDAYRGEASTFTGSFLNQKVYVLGRLGLRSVGYPNKTRVSITEDGVGFPVQINVFYYDPIYGSLENAEKYQKSVVVISINILVEGVAANPLFEPYRAVLAQVKNPYTSSVMSASAAFEWLLPTLTAGYFVYPGSAIEAVTGRQLPCATVISPNFDKHPWLSYGQWEAINNLLNSNYQPLTNPIPLFPLAGRFFAQANSSVYYSYY